MGNKTDHDIKRKAWLAVFLLCAVFWVIVGLIVYYFLRPATHF
ncbi:YmiA family putative membrane protein [Acerihabitans sp. KWT182]|uniref:YmiA family putative membrane protein n=1 Tax=Acerihabitans sp. KWT182 TaxID=3157919 RepID=A0AAU7Q6V8_9GAMM